MLVAIDNSSLGTLDCMPRKHGLHLSFYVNEVMLKPRPYLLLKPCPAVALAIFMP